jgi:hypothetical protein
MDFQDLIVRSYIDGLKAQGVDTTKMEDDWASKQAQRIANEPVKREE